MPEYYDISQELREQIQNLQKEGLGRVQIAKRLNTTEGIARLWIKKSNCNYKPFSIKTVNYNPFEDLANPEVQYWLGWIVTDGNLHDKRINITTTLKDLDVAQNYCKFLGIEESKIMYYKNKDKNWDTRLTIRFGHKETFDFLKSLGITENKSLTIDPNITFTNEFVRGLIEGDGHFGISRNKVSCVFSSSSKKLIDKYIVYLNKNNIQGCLSITKPHDNVHTHYRMQLSVKATIKLINLIYPNDCTLYCKRKFEKAQQIKQLIEQKKNILH